GLQINRRHGGSFFRFRDLFYRSRPLPSCRPILSALDRMAAAAGNRSLERLVASEIDQILRQGGLSTNSLATFLPEITSSGPAGKKARRALLFLLGLAQELQSLKHPVHTLEMVSGSLIDCIWAGKKCSIVRPNGEPGEFPEDAPE